MTKNKQKYNYIEEQTKPATRSCVTLFVAKILNLKFFYNFFLLQQRIKTNQPIY